MQQEERDAPANRSELSEVWQQLLGEHHAQDSKSAGNEANDASIPTLADDPWSVLSHSNGIESIDIQKLRLHMSEQDLERVLQIMQEQPARKSLSDE
jgi:hypothetical protein